MTNTATEKQFHRPTHANAADYAHCDVRHMAVRAALSSKELEKIQGIALTRVHAEGELILAAEDVATIAGTVVKGTIKAYKLLADGRQQIIGFLQPGDFIGSVRIPIAASPRRSRRSSFACFHCPA